MKKIFIIASFFLSVISVLAGPAKLGKVNGRVLAAFEKDFISTSNISWSIINDINVVSFSQLNKNYMAYYDGDGELKGVGNIVPQNDLPKQLQNSIEQKYRMAEIKNVIQFRSPISEVQYYVHINTNKGMKILRVDANGSVEVLRSLKK